MDYFSPMPDQQSDIMRPVNPLLGAAPVDPMIPQDIGTPVVHLFDTAHQFPSQGLGGLPEMLDVFNAARFLFDVE